MKNLLVTGVSALALLFGAAGLAQANHSLSSNLGSGFLDAMAGDGGEGDIWTNFSVNAGDVDASIDISAEGAFVNIDLDASAAGDGSVSLDVPQQTFDIEGPGSGVLNVDWRDNGQVVTGDLETLAAGAINEGHIASAVSDSEESFALGLEVDTSSAANTTNTAASASFDSAFGIETSSAQSGPMEGVFAANFAYNNASVDASVLVSASDVTVGDVSTLAAGAINTGTISMGFDGSALNSALNVD